LRYFSRSYSVWNLDYTGSGLSNLSLFNQEKLCTIFLTFCISFMDFKSFFTHFSKKDTQKRHCLEYSLRLMLVRDRPKPIKVELEPVVDLAMVRVVLVAELPRRASFGEASISSPSRTRSSLTRTRPGGPLSGSTRIDFMRFYEIMSIYNIPISYFSAPEHWTVDHIDSTSIGQHEYIFKK